MCQLFFTEMDNNLLGTLENRLRYDTLEEVMNEI